MALITYKDKVSLVENPDIADENKVTAQDMNEIKKVVNENQSLTYDSLPVGSVIDFDGDTVPTGYEEIKDTQILWTNPNTTVEFHAQSITLSSSDYDTLEWYFRVARDRKYVMVTKTIKGWGGKIINYNDDGSLRYRYMNRNNDISYEITSPGFDGALIPMYVIGYKTGLFS